MKGTERPGVAGAVPALHVFAPGLWVAAAAGFIADAMESAVSSHGECRIALAGGSTPRPVYEALAEDAGASVPWESVEVFFGDERCVPADDPDSNFSMARSALLQHVSITESSVHRIQGDLAPEQAAMEYASRIGDAPLDLVLLGMGGDGHTASLFPRSPALDETGRRVVATRSPVAPHDRVTLTLPVLNRARRVVLLVTGASKAARLAEAYGQLAEAAPELPIARIRPQRLDWILDREVAALLSR